MSRGILYSKTLAFKANHQLLCAAPDIRSLTIEQVSDLHLFKHELLAAVHRLYQRVPSNLADPIISKYFAVRVSDLENVEFSDPSGD